MLEGAAVFVCINGGAVWEHKTPHSFRKKKSFARKGPKHMSQHKDKTTFFITKYLQELKRKRKVILCGIKAPCLSAGESLVCQRETKQLMIKLLPPQFKEIPTYQKLVIKYNLGIKECVISYQNRSLFGSQLVAKSLLYSSGQLGFFFFFLDNSVGSYPGFAFDQRLWLLSALNAYHYFWIPCSLRLLLSLPIW